MREIRLVYGNGTKRVQMSPETLESQQWLKAHSFLSCLFFLFLWLPAPAWKHCLLCFYKHQMYKHALTRARKGSHACYTWKKLFHLQGWNLANGCCNTWSEVKMLFKRVFFDKTAKCINMGDRNLHLNFFRHDFYFFLSCSVAIAIHFEQNWMSTRSCLSFFN